ncbi:MAG: acyl-CoA thioesterase [Phycisphaerales bacterium]
MSPHKRRKDGPGVALASEGVVRVRVRYAECDPMGVAHHASYARGWRSGGRRSCATRGRATRRLERAGVFLVVTKLEVKYRRPIRYDDVLEVRTRVMGGSRVKIRHEYEVVVLERRGAAVHPDDPAVHAGGAAAIAATELACVGPDGRAGVARVADDAGCVTHPLPLGERAG